MYAATKAGLSAFAEAFAREVAVHGIRVLIVEPGLTDTGLRAARVQRESAAARAQAGPAQAMDPATVAAAIAFAVTRPVGVAVTALAIEPLDRPP
jgi:NADP-dependent 3-hydroxy acid dehydrogenase YdfG